MSLVFHPDLAAEPTIEEQAESASQEAGSAWTLAWKVLHCPEPISGAALCCEFDDIEPCFLKSCSFSTRHVAPSLGAKSSQRSTAAVSSPAVRAMNGEG